MELKQHDNDTRRFGFSYDKGSWYDEEGNPCFYGYGAKTFHFVYVNKEDLNFYDFLEVIKENLLEHLTKNRAFIFEGKEDEDDDLKLWWENEDDEDEDEDDEDEDEDDEDEDEDENYGDIRFSILCEGGYGMDDEFYGFCGYGFDFNAGANFGVDGICVNTFVKDLLNCANEKFKAFSFDDYKCYNDKKFTAENFDEEFIVNSLSVEMRLNPYKVHHKNKFHKKLHDEIVESVWQPSRYLGFEELRALQERWPQNE